MGSLEKGELEKQPQIVQDVYGYLGSKGVIFWHLWIIAGKENERGRLDAAKWLVEEMRQVARVVSRAGWVELYHSANREEEERNG